MCSTSCGRVLSSLLLLGASVTASLSMPRTNKGQIPMVVTDASSVNGGLEKHLEHDFQSADGTPAQFVAGFPKIWGEERTNITHLPGDTTRVSISPDRTLLAIALTDRMLLYDMSTSELKRTLFGHKGHISTVQFSPDGKTLVTSSVRYGWDNESITRVWNVSRELERTDDEPGDDVPTLDGSLYSFGSQAFTPDGKYILYHGDFRHAAAWNVVGGKEAFRMRHDDSIIWAGGSSDGRHIATSSWDSTVRIWDVASSELLRTLRGPGAQGWAAAFSPDGGAIAAGYGDGTVWVWDVASGSRLRVLPKLGGWVRSLAWASDGRRIAAGAGFGTVAIIDVLTGNMEQRWSLEKQGGPPTANEIVNVQIAGVRGNETLVFKTQSQNVEMFDMVAQVKREMGPDWPRPGWSNDDFVVSPDGKILVSVDKDRTARFWDL